MRALVIVLSMVAAVTYGAERPTPEAIQAAVEQSRAEFNRKNPPPTKEQFITKKTEEVKRLEKQRAKAKSADKKALTDEITAAKESIAAAKKNYVPELRDRLAEFRFPLKVGQVGHVGYIKVTEIISETATRGELGYFDNGPRAEWHSIDEVLFTKIDTESMSEGKFSTGDWDFVIVQKRVDTFELELFKPTFAAPEKN